MSRLHRSHTGLAAGLAMSLAATGAAWSSPLEHGVDPTGIAGAVGLAYGDHTVNADLSSVTEVDRYTFAGVAGDKLRFIVRATSGGVDPTLVLRAPGTGAVLGTTSCAGFIGTGPCSTYLDFTLEATGRHTINIFDQGADESGQYEIHLDRYPPIDNWQGIGYSSPVVEGLGHSTDLDFFAFEGVAGTTVAVAIRGLSGGVDPRLEIWDPTGALIVDSGCTGFIGSGPCSKVEEINLGMNGIYRLAAADQGWDEVGTYQIEVSCLFGDCPLPSAAPPAVPEPGTYAMLVLGMAAIGWVARGRTSRALEVTA